jgi:hypothetical protein
MWRILIMTTSFLVPALLVPAGPAAAYIGPGVGAGLIATVLGIVTAMALVAFAVVWYPLKRLLRKNANHSESSTEDNDRTKR